MFSLFERSMAKYHPYSGRVWFGLKVVHEQSSWGGSAYPDSKGLRVWRIHPSKIKTRNLKIDGRHSFT